jgi:hypothetical protein
VAANCDVWHRSARPVAGDVDGEGVPELGAEVALDDGTATIVVVDADEPRGVRPLVPQAASSDEAAQARSIQRRTMARVYPPLPTGHRLVGGECEPDA